MGSKKFNAEHINVYASGYHIPEEYLAYIIMAKKVQFDNAYT